MEKDTAARSSFICGQHARETPSYVCPLHLVIGARRTDRYFVASVLEAGAAVASGKIPDMMPMLAAGVSSLTGTSPETVTTTLSKAKSMLGMRKRAPQQQQQQQRRVATSAAVGAVTNGGNTQKPASGAAPATSPARPATATAPKAVDPNFSLPAAGTPIKPKLDAAFSEPDGRAPVIMKSATTGSAGSAVVGTTTTTTSTLPAGAVKAGDSIVRAAGGTAGSKAGVATPAPGLVAITPTA